MFRYGDTFDRDIACTTTMLASRFFSYSGEHPDDAKTKYEK